MNTLYRFTHCPWCWRALHLPFPESWTSSICPLHHHAIRAASAQRKAAKLARLAVAQ
jgi:hypothetical protein